MLWARASRWASTAYRWCRMTTSVGRCISSPKGRRHSPSIPTRRIWTASSPHWNRRRTRWIVWEWNWHRNTMRWQRQSLTWRWTCLAAVSTTRWTWTAYRKWTCSRQRTMSFCVQPPLMAQTSCSLVWYRQANGNECGLPKTRTSTKSILLLPCLQTSCRKDRRRSRQHQKSKERKPRWSKKRKSPPISMRKSIENITRKRISKHLLRKRKILGKRRMWLFKEIITLLWKRRKKQRVSRRKRPRTLPSWSNGRSWKPSIQMLCCCFV